MAWRRGVVTGSPSTHDKREGRMARHGSESFFVIGVGLLDESVGGRTESRAALQGAPDFRFSRMGPKGGRDLQLSDAALKAVAKLMVAANGGGSSQIPAGFTYLGQ